MKYQMECEALQAYLASSHYIDWQHPLIQRKAAELFADCKEEREKIKAAFTRNYYRCNYNNDIIHDY